MLEHGDQVWVSPIVEHQKAGINGVGDAINRDIYRVRVAAQIIVFLKQGNLVRASGMAFEQIRTGKPGDASTDHRNFHAVIRLWCSSRI